MKRFPKEQGGILSIQAFVVPQGSDGSRKTQHEVAQIEIRRLESQMMQQES